MPTDLNLIKTIVVFRTENRSFEHLLGYLSVAHYHCPNVDGLHKVPARQARVSSPYVNSLFPPVLLTNPCDDIALRMGSSVHGVLHMSGFVTNFPKPKSVSAVNPGDAVRVMGYSAPEQVPITDSLAQNPAFCDHWFCALPAGQRSKRLMWQSQADAMGKLAVV
jgi:phospholipase C